MNQKKHIKFYFFLFLFNFLISHLYPLIVFLTNLLALIVLHFIKKYSSRNYLGFFLFIFWPCCFYVYLDCFVNTVVNEGTLLSQTYESPYFINISLESFSFWVLRISDLSTVQCPIFGFELNSVYFKQFLFETFYCLAVICDSLNLSFNIKIY